MNQYHHLLTCLFTYDHIRQDLVNRLVIGARNSGKINLGRVPYRVYVDMCSEGRKKETSRTVHRDLGSFAITHVNYAFDGFLEMPKLDGSGAWAMKILEYPIIMNGIQVGVSSYKLYYTKLHFFYNMERSMLEAKFLYEVEIWNNVTKQYEPLAAPKQSKQRKQTKVTK
jgi:hypothetical protein